MDLVSIILSVIGIFISIIGVVVSIWCWRHVYSEIKQYNKLARSLYDLDCKDPAFLRKFHTTAEKMYKIRQEMVLIEIKDDGKQAPEGYVTQNYVLSHFMELSNKFLTYFDSHPKERKQFNKKLKRL